MEANGQEGGRHARLLPVIWLGVRWLHGCIYVLSTYPINFWVLVHRVASRRTQRPSIISVLTSLSLFLRVPLPLRSLQHLSSNPSDCPHGETPIIRAKRMERQLVIWLPSFVAFFFLFRFVLCSFGDGLTCLDCSVMNTFLFLFFFSFSLLVCAPAQSCTVHSTHVFNPTSIFNSTFPPSR